MLTSRSSQKGAFVTNAVLGSGGGGGKRYLAAEAEICKEVQEDAKE